eukprot:4449400-Amphidinium_carterae.3
MGSVSYRRDSQCTRNKDPSNPGRSAAALTRSMRKCSESCFVKGCRTGSQFGSHDFGGHQAQWTSTKKGVDIDYNMGGHEKPCQSTSDVA